MERETFFFCLKAKSSIWNIYLNVMMWINNWKHMEEKNLHFKHECCKLVNFYYIEKYVSE